MTAALASWPQAARDLARRVHRRELWGAWLVPTGRGLLLGGLLALAAKALGLATPLAFALLGGGMVVGLVGGFVRCRTVPPVGEDDAAWALDRLGQTDGRGLAAATLRGPGAAEAGWGAGHVAPPPVRLLPPRGLAIALGGVLAVGLAVLAPAREGPPAPGARAAASGGSNGADAGEDASAAEQATLQASRRAQATGAVREAMSLGTQAAQDPQRVAESLADPDVRARIEAALEGEAAGSEIAGLLAGGASPDEVARALAAGAQAEVLARAARRRAAAARAAGGFPSIPPHRRAFLERYFSTPNSGDR